MNVFGEFRLKLCCSFQAGVSLFRLKNGRNHSVPRPLVPIPATGVRPPLEGPSFFVGRVLGPSYHGGLPQNRGLRGRGRVFSELALGKALCKNRPLMPGLATRCFSFLACKVFVSFFGAAVFCRQQRKRLGKR